MLSNTPFNVEKKMVSFVCKIELVCPDDDCCVNMCRTLTKNVWKVYKEKKISYGRQHAFCSNYVLQIMMSSWWIHLLWSSGEWDFFFYLEKVIMIRYELVELTTVKADTRLSECKDSLHCLVNPCNSLQCNVINWSLWSHYFWRWQEKLKKIQDRLVTL